MSVEGEGLGEIDLAQSLREFALVQRSGKYSFSPDLLERVADYIDVIERDLRQKRSALKIATAALERIDRSRFSQMATWATDFAKQTLNSIKDIQQ